MKEIPLAEAKNRLSALVQEVEDTGEDVVITKHGRAAVRITRPRRPARGAEERGALATDLQLLRNKMTRVNPQSAKPVAWEKVRGWIIGEGGSDKGGRGK